VVRERKVQAERGIRVMLLPRAGKGSFPLGLSLMAGSDPQKGEGRDELTCPLAISCPPGCPHVSLSTLHR
jgi:hypothetical protein